jgi:hypothetical protein
MNPSPEGAEQESCMLGSANGWIETRSYQRLISTQDAACVPVSPQATPSIVGIVRKEFGKEFGKGNDFCKKVTYRASGKSEDVIKAFRTASKYRTVVPTEAELIAELERERRVIEQKQNGGDT